MDMSMSLSRVTEAPAPEPGAEIADLDQMSVALSERIIALVEQGKATELDSASVQHLMHALVLLYGARFKAELREPPVPGGRNIEATPVLVTVSAMLKAANLELFELGMWQSWSGTR